ncbi:MAG: hypothetical protein WA989_03480 [Henriciella sp.]|uniref:hypothetical protein n=1 Tax=Henriciella sp. TaxID=1968823 RepID=UPI003C774545
MNKFEYLLACGLIAGGLSASASAIEANEWHVMSSTEDGAVVAISTGSDTENGAYISCAEDELVVGIGVVPGSVADLIRGSSSTRKRTRNAVTTFGDETSDTDWVYYPGRKVAISDDVVTAKKIYNSAVKREDVAWKMDFKDEVVVNFPAINDTFKSFANDCPVTNPGNQ